VLILVAVRVSAYGFGRYSATNRHTKYLYSLDLDGFWETLMTREAEDYRDPASCDYNYAFSKTEDGHEVEVVTR